MLEGQGEDNRGRARAVSPEDLAKRLAAQCALGNIGERIAIAYEHERLKAEGAKNPERFVEDVSLRNVAAGYDIWSYHPRAEERFIEVKAMTGDSSRFFLTRNEIKAWRALANAAFLNLVKVAEPFGGIGRVVQEIRNPIAVLEATSAHIPLVYEVAMESNGDGDAG